MVAVCWWLWWCVVGWDGEVVVMIGGCEDGCGCGFSGVVGVVVGGCSGVLVVVAVCWWL